MSPTDKESADAALRAVLGALAPGTELREGLERILRGQTGALIVLGHDRVVESICTGGFGFDVPFTATGLRELAKMRLDEVSRTLSTLEIEDLVTIRDVSTVPQRLEMVLRIASEIEWFVIELCVDGRLIGLQLDELIAGLEAERDLVVRDYLPAS